MVLDIFALIVMVVILAVVIWLVVLLGPLPGKIAMFRALFVYEGVVLIGAPGQGVYGDGDPCIESNGNGTADPKRGTADYYGRTVKWALPASGYAG